MTTSYINKKYISKRNEWFQEMYKTTKNYQDSAP